MSSPLAAALAERDRGLDFKRGLEGLLLALDERAGELLLQGLHEGRGAWGLCLRSSARELLYLGDPLAGTVPALARLGAQVTVLARAPTCSERTELSRWRDDAHVPGCTRTVRAPEESVLPFEDGRFDVVVLDEGLPVGRAQAAQLLAECARVCRGELVVVGDNRLGYKRSTGLRRAFEVPAPHAYLHSALFPARGERTLRAYRAELARGGLGCTRAFALYPDRLDYAHVVALDAPRPELMLGPKERQNRLKLCARALGLFPLLAPSFAVFGARAAASAADTRVERVLDALAQATGEPRPELEHIVATRGGNALLFTRPKQASAAPQGAWVVHVPLSHKKMRQTRRHAEVLRALPQRFPRFSVPQLLFHGTLEGIELACERRLDGWAATHLAGDTPRTARMLADTARDLAGLVVRPAQAFTAADFEREVAARIELVRAHANVPETVARLARLADELRPRLVGRSLARVLHHADLRSKHVQVDGAGGVLGYLDWSTTEDESLPYWDLLHLVVHERKQVRGGSVGQVWRDVLEERDLDAHEREALASYRAALGLDDETARVLTELYPIYVTAMGEKNWDYSRPRWLQRNFGL